MKRRLNVLVLSSILLHAAAASAESPFNASKSMRENLKTLAGAQKAVTVVLGNGKEYRAHIAQVGDNELLLTGIAGREFFDVLIDLDEIVAVEAQARER